MPPRLTVFCDETGAHDCQYFGWGSIWCPSESVPELNQAIDALCKKTNHHKELKWSRTGASDARQAAIEWFFETPWLCFQSMWVRRSTLGALTRRDSTFAYRKLLYAMLGARMHQFNQLPGGPREFEVRADRVGAPDTARARKEFRLLQRVCASQSPGIQRLLVDFERVDSREHRGVQLADVLVGAVGSSWHGHPSGSKHTLCRAIARQLGWPDLRAKTENNLKFHIWMPADFGIEAHDPPTRDIALASRGGDPRRFFANPQYRVSGTRPHLQD